MKADFSRLTHRSSLLGIDVVPYLRRTWELIEESRFTGYDPGTLYHDSKLRFLLSDRNRRVFRFWNGLVYKIVRLAGYGGIRLLRPKKVNSTKAVALCASAFAYLYEAYGEPSFRETGEELLDELERRADPACGLWAPDFDWWSRGQRISRNSVPCSINSSFSLDAFWDWGVLTDEKCYLDRFLKGGRSLMVSLPHATTGDVACFHYSPCVAYLVHNANLLVASILARVLYWDDDRSLAELAGKCISYSMRDIQTSGSVPYAGAPTENRTVDNYHTGYVLRALERIRQYPIRGLDYECLASVIEFALRFYVSTFVDSRGVYRFARRTSIQAHSLAEALCVYAAFSGGHSDCFKEHFFSGARSAFRRLWDGRRRYFINEIHLLAGGLKRKDVTPMPRWAWSWMFHGLSALILSENGESKRR